MFFRSVPAFVAVAIATPLAGCTGRGAPDDPDGELDAGSVVDVLDAGTVDAGTGVACDDDDDCAGAEQCLSSNCGLRCTTPAPLDGPCQVRIVDGCFVDNACIDGECAELGWCMASALGESCFSGEPNSTDGCVDGVCGIDGTCVPARTVGAFCSDHDDCDSGICGDGAECAVTYSNGIDIAACTCLASDIGGPCANDPNGPSPPERDGCIDGLVCEDAICRTP